MRKRRYEMLLPLRYNDGNSIEDEKIYQTRESLDSTRFRFCLGRCMASGFTKEPITKTNCCA